MSYGSTPTQVRWNKSPLVMSRRALAGLVCSAVCLVVALQVAVEGGFELGGGAGEVELLCSDGRCGEGSQLSQARAAKDLDQYADKSELKDRLDELQTSMERGMSHKAEVSQLNSYFNKLDSAARKERSFALHQAQKEGQTMGATLSAKHRTPSLHTQDETDAAKEDVSDSEDDKVAEDKQENIEDVDNSMDPVAHEHDAISKRRGMSSISALNQYFDRQAKKIQNENQEQAHRTTLSGAQADKDLDSYFDQLEAQTRTGKGGRVHDLERQVRSLNVAVHKLRKPVVAAAIESTKTHMVVKEISDDEDKIIALEKSRGDGESKKPSAADVIKADQAKVDSDAKKIAALKRDEARHEDELAHHTEVYKGVEAAKDVAPKAAKAPLPAGWHEFHDKKTNHPYWYNAKTGTSSWVDPAGLKTLKGARAGKAHADETAQARSAARESSGGWEEQQDAKANHRGMRERAEGVKLLSLLHEANEAKHAQAAKIEAADKRVALKADHGVYGHEWPRSQWADKGWMHFLTDSNAKGMGSARTPMQQLSAGRPVSDHALLKPASSSQY